MRVRHVAAVVVFGVGLAASIFVAGMLGLIPHGSGARLAVLRALPELTASANGDTNGDGRRDIADAVFLLEWLFLGGAAPVDCASSESTCGLPATGQLTCHADDGAELPCVDAAFPGQDAAYRAGCGGLADAAGDRFADGGDGTVSDRCTGLEWGRVDVSAQSSTWSEALRLAERAILAADGSWVEDAAAAAARGGVIHDDWRLPNARELASLVDYARTGPAVAPPFAALASGHWTSTSFVARPGEAWCVHLFDGTVEPISKAAHLHVLVVRGG